MAYWFLQMADMVAVDQRVRQLGSIVASGVDSGRCWYEVSVDIETAREVWERCAVFGVFPRQLRQLDARGQGALMARQRELF